MIGRIRGTLVVKKAPWLIVELQSGLGFEIEASMSTFYRLPELGKEVVLYTHQVVREDAQLLYGFSDDKERSLFRTLIKVNGVGPKLALTILSSLEPQAFVDCVNTNDSASLVRVPGIGKKTAERLVIEMRDRLADLFPSNDQDIASVGGAPVMPQQTSPTQEAISALVALGYKPQEASRLVSPIDCNGLSCEAIIRQALQGVMA